MLSYTQYFAESLIKEAEVDDKIKAIHAAIGGGTDLNYFQKKFPERCFDVGIAEQHAVTFAAAGLATKGDKPFCVIYSSFLQRGMTYLRNEPNVIIHHDLKPRAFIYLVARDCENGNVDRKGAYDGPIAGSSVYADDGAGACSATGDGDIVMHFLPCKMDFIQDATISSVRLCS